MFGEVMNFKKKRARQNGRQQGVISQREAAYRKAYYDGQGKVIERMIEAGLLPRVEFEVAESPV